MRNIKFGQAQMRIEEYEKDCLLISYKTTIGTVDKINRTFSITEEYFSRTTQRHKHKFRKYLIDKGYAEIRK